MSSRNKTDVKKLFEFWCEVTRSHSNGSVERNSSTRTNGGTPAHPAGIIVESFPESFRDEKTIADISTFAFPCESESDAVQTYSFVLTTDDSKWRFGFCRHDPKTDSAMVIITYLPWHDTFLRLLPVLAELRRTDNSGDFRTFLAEAYNRGVPDPGGSLKLFYNGVQSPFVFERPLQFQLPSIPTNYNLNLYYNFVDPKNMIAVFAAMLAERRIIFTSRRLDRLSSCIQAANAFLYPMVWQHIFIPVLPMKLKDYLSAPMPYLIGVPESVLETMTPDELGEVVTLNCDTKIFESPFDDVHEMPAEIVSQLKKQLSHSAEHIGDRVSKIFLGVLVQLIGGYRDAVEFRNAGKSFNRDKFIESRPSHLRPFLAKMMELQIFQQFIDERLEMLNTGLGFSDEFELETVRYAEKMKKRGRNYAFLKNVKDKTNPAVKSAVKSVKESSRGVKTAYKDLKSKFRDITPPSNAHFRSHLASNSQHDRIDGFVVGGGKSGGGHHSAPSSPIFSKRVGGLPTAGGFQYASPEALNGHHHHQLHPQSNNHPRRAAPPPLAMSSSAAHIRSNGCAGASLGATHHAGHLAASPAVSPASSLCSSEMNLSQELQNHPLFKSPIVDRSLKPSSSLELNHRFAGVAVAARLDGPPRPPPPSAAAAAAGAAHSLQATSVHGGATAAAAVAAATPFYYNHPYAPHTQPQLHIETRQPAAPRPQHHHHNSSSQHHRLLQHNHRHLPPTLTTTPTPTHTSTPTHTPTKFITTTDSAYDNPPEMQSPPVPPRRQCNTTAAAATSATTAAAAVHAGINRLERNCWQNYAVSGGSGGSGGASEHSLRGSSSSNTSASSAASAASASMTSGSCSSSSASFVSAASHLSPQQLQQQQQQQPPVPAPRLKKEKESLRSLQPQHMKVASSSAASQQTTEDNSINDLISLDDSNNASFDLEDFDPLNQNARPLPLSSGVGGGISGGGVSRSKKSTTLPSGTSSAQMMSASVVSSGVSNPLYPYFTPQHGRPLQPPQPPFATTTTTTKPPPLPTTRPPPMPPPDEDFELLRKYGLDQFTLTTAASANSNGSATSAAAAALTLAGGMSNWTTFD